MRMPDSTPMCTLQDQGVYNQRWYYVLIACGLLLAPISLVAFFGLRTRIRLTVDDSTVHILSPQRKHGIY